MRDGAFGGNARLHMAVSFAMSAALLVGNVGLMMVKKHGLSVMSVKKKAQGVLQTIKKVPNPWGKKGGPAHQAGIEEMAGQFEGIEGITIRYEIK